MLASLDRLATTQPHAQQRHPTSTLRWTVRGLEIALEARGADDVLRWSSAVARHLMAIRGAGEESWPDDAANLHERVQRAWQRLFDLHHSYGDWESTEAQHACMALDHAEAALRRMARAPRRRKAA